MDYAYYSTTCISSTTATTTTNNYITQWVKLKVSAANVARMKKQQTQFNQSEDHVSVVISAASSIKTLTWLVPIAGLLDSHDMNKLTNNTMTIIMSYVSSDGMQCVSYCWTFYLSCYRFSLKKKMDSHYLTPVRWKWVPGLIKWLSWHERIVVFSHNTCRSSRQDRTSTQAERQRKKGLKLP